MSRLLVNIRGCNGSGKSTVPLQMMNDPDLYVMYRTYDGKKKGLATVFPNYGWVALGTYFNKTGGLDCFPNNDLTQKTLWYVLKKFPKYNILMEGVISSTIFSTYANLFSEVEKLYPETEVIVLNLTPPLKVCLSRIYERNGNKPIKEDAVKTKWDIVNRNIDKFYNCGFSVLSWDTSKTKKEDMLKEFLTKVDSARREEIVCM